jgi:hypothetical protein
MAPVLRKSLATDRRNTRPLDRCIVSTRAPLRHYTGMTEDQQRASTDGRDSDTGTHVTPSARDMSVPEGRKLVAPGERKRTWRKGSGMRQAPKGRQKNMPETPVCRPSGASFVDTPLSGGSPSAHPRLPAQGPSGAGPRAYCSKSPVPRGARTYYGRAGGTQESSSGRAYASPEKRDGMRQAPKGRQKDISETPVCRPSGASFD